MSKTHEKFYEEMFLIRYFEEHMERLFKKGELVGTVHGCIGQEAVAVGVVSALSKGDIVTGNHRSHGHFLAYCGDIKGLMAEIMGKEIGIVAGRGGSQHLQKMNFYSNGVQGSLVPVAVGMAYAESLKKSDHVVICFLGDGTLGQGVVYEALNMASLWSLPVIFVVENNAYAMSTRTEDAAAGTFVGRGRAFGIESNETTTSDVEVIFDKAKEIVHYVRTNKRPFFWVINTYRFCGHSKGDDKAYRTKEEETERLQTDPLKVLREKLGAAVCEPIEAKCVKWIDDVYQELNN